MHWNGLHLHCLGQTSHLLRGFTLQGVTASTWFVALPHAEWRLCECVQVVNFATKRGVLMGIVGQAEHIAKKAKHLVICSPVAEVGLAQKGVVYPVLSCNISMLLVVTFE